MPVPKNNSDVVRWEHSRLRRRMLTGQWESDLKHRLTTSLGTTRSDVIRDVDLSSNVFSSVCTTLSNNYNENPDIGNTVDPQAAGLMTAMLAEAGYTSIMQNLQRLTLGLREMLLAVDVVESDDPALPASICLRPVYPDVVVASAKHVKSYELQTVSEARLVCIDDEERWVWYQASDNDTTPYLRAIDCKTGDDISELVLGGVFYGANYPFFTATKKPVLPYIIYHAQITSNLWNHEEWSELVAGTLEIGVDRSAYHYNLRNAAWAQRYAINCNLAGSEVEGRSQLIADPSTIIMLEAIMDGVQPSTGQWQPPFSPVEMQTAVGEDERRLAAYAGIPATDLLRISGDPRSGYALALSTEGKKSASRKFEPAFKRSDVKLFETIACMVNSYLDQPVLPEKGWTISYRSQSMSEGEMADRQKRILEQVSAGLLSKVDARRQLYGESAEEAQIAIEKINREDQANV